MSNSKTYFVRILPGPAIKRDENGVETILTEEEIEAFSKTGCDLDGDLITIYEEDKTMPITAELIDNRIGETPFRRDLWLNVKVETTAGNRYTVSIAIRDPWTYKDISRTKYVREVPTDSDYGPMIVHILKFEHPNIIFMWEYDNMTRRITIETVPNYIRSKYGTTIAPPSWHEKSKENNTMRFTKVVVNGPATIAWVTTGRNPAKKVVIKKADGDIYDLEKAMLLCWAKSWFSDDTDFHKWFRLNMKMFEEAYEVSKANGDSIANAYPNCYNGQEIANNINNSLDRLSERLKDAAKKLYSTSVYGIKAKEKQGAAWSWDEVSFLNRHYNSKSVKHIAMVLGRSEAAVRAKARKLGIKRGGDTNDT